VVDGSICRGRDVILARAVVRLTRYHPRTASDHVCNDFRWDRLLRDLIPDEVEREFEGWLSV
jgi:hypothetical protein